jgi:uncharacterized phiE125 gp8 family phage protein
MIPDTVFSLEGAKAHLRVLHDHEDALITGYLRAAVARVEQYTGLGLHAREGVVWRVPVRSLLYWQGVMFPLSPVKACTVKLPGGRELLAGEFSVGFTPTQANVLLVHGSAMAGLSYDDTLEVSYDIAGLDEDEANADLLTAVYLILGDLYAQREAASVGTIIAINPAVESLLAPHRVSLVA